MQNQWGKRAVQKSRWIRGNDSRMEGRGKQIEAWGWVVVEEEKMERFLHPGTDWAEGACSFWDSCMLLCRESV